MPVNLTGLDLKFSFNKITSLLGTIKLINLDEFDASSEIKALKDAITNVCNTVDNQLETLDAEIEALNASVEADKSTMQALEAQMKQIRPSIDLANPETAWFLTVNITNRQRG
jgi:peptidoglycan hydrolase CwlO-like protein